MDCCRWITISLCVGVIPSFFSPGALRAQTVNDSGQWLALFANGDLGREESCHSFKWWFDGHARFFDDANGFGQSILRPGIGYVLRDTATVWAGYGWIRTSPGASPQFDEHRLWQQVTWSNQLDPATLGFRSRLEQRFLDTGSETGWRFRQLVSLRRPLDCAPRLSLVAWDELFIHLNDTDWGADAGYDQNRLFFGFGLKRDPTRRNRVEAGYLFQHIDFPAGGSLNNHLLSINFYYSP